MSEWYILRLVRCLSVRIVAHVDPVTDVCCSGKLCLCLSLRPLGRPTSRSTPGPPPPRPNRKLVVPSDCDDSGKQVCVRCLLEGQCPVPTTLKKEVLLGTLHLPFRFICRYFLKCFRSVSRIPPTSCLFARFHILLSFPSSLLSLPSSRLVAFPPFRLPLSASLFPLSSSLSLVSGRSRRLSLSVMCHARMLAATCQRLVSVNPEQDGCVIGAGQAACLWIHTNAVPCNGQVGLWERRRRELKRRYEQDLCTDNGWPRMGI